MWCSVDCQTRAAAAACALVASHALLCQGYLCQGFLCQSYLYQTYLCQGYLCQGYLCQDYLCQSYLCQSYLCQPSLSEAELPLATYILPVNMMIPTQHKLLIPINRSIWRWWLSFRWCWSSKVRGRKEKSAESGICICFSRTNIDSSVILNSLGLLCLWQCLFWTIWRSFWFVVGIFDKEHRNTQPD